MPLILMGVAILFIALIIIPLVILLFTNPVVFGAGLIIIGILWVVVPKVFYWIGYCLFKPYYLWNEKLKPILKTKKWWKPLVNIISIIDSDFFAKTFIYSLVCLGVVLVIYFQYNPINQ